MVTAGSVTYREGTTSYDVTGFCICDGIRIILSSDFQVAVSYSGYVGGTRLLVTNCGAGSNSVGSKAGREGSSAGQIQDCGIGHCHGVRSAASADSEAAVVERTVGDSK